MVKRSRSQVGAPDKNRYWPLIALMGLAAILLLISGQQKNIQHVNAEEKPQSGEERIEIAPLSEESATKVLVELTPKADLASVRAAIEAIGGYISAELPIVQSLAVEIEPKSAELLNTIDGVTRVISDAPIHSVDRKPYESLAVEAMPQSIFLPLATNPNTDQNSARDTPDYSDIVESDFGTGDDTPPPTRPTPPDPTSNSSRDDNGATISTAVQLETVTAYNITHEWTEIKLINDYANMVVSCTATRSTNSLPFVVRVDQATRGNTLQLRIQNPADEALEPETVYCLVVEEGVWQLPDGNILEAIRVDNPYTDYGYYYWLGQYLHTQYDFQNPVVLGQVMSHNDARWSVFWSSGWRVKDPAEQGIIFVGKHVGEDYRRNRSAETLGVIVMESGTGSVDDIPYAVGVTPDSIVGTGNNLDAFNTVALPSIFAVSPAFSILAQTGMDGWNGSWPVMPTDFASRNNLRLRMDEDQQNDWERGHTSEQVAYFISQQPLLITPDSDPRVTEGLAALYTFNAGNNTLIHDVSGVKHPLNLAISAPDAVVWQSDGLQLVGQGDIVSTTPAHQIKNRCKMSDSLTVEAWVQADTDHADETTLIALGAGTTQRNFMLGQDGNDWVARVRTNAADADGGSALVASQSVYQNELQHVVFSWGKTSGTQRITVDNVQIASQSLEGDFNNWNGQYRLSLGSEDGSTQGWTGALQLVAVYC
ncbi:MAG TPA: LamG domain-containing protein, partial [Anaerolineae bacterium]|nr:LamG domain-containing protein [Anaerolineae bacterium]